MLINFDDKVQPVWSYLDQYAYTIIHIPHLTLIKIQGKFPPNTSIPTCTYTIIWNVIVGVIQQTGL